MFFFTICYLNLDFNSFAPMSDLHIVIQLLGAEQCENTVDVLRFIQSAEDLYPHTVQVSLPKLTQLRGIGRSLLFLLVAIISIMSCHL